MPPVNSQTITTQQLKGSLPAKLLRTLGLGHSMSIIYKNGLELNASHGLNRFVPESHKLLGSFMSGNWENQFEQSSTL